MGAIKRYRGWLIAIAVIALVIFVMVTIGRSGPHLRSTATDNSAMIQAISGLVAAVLGPAGIVGFISALKPQQPASPPPMPVRFREVRKSYDGDDVVDVEIFDGRVNGKDQFVTYRCRPIDWA